MAFTAFFVAPVGYAVYLSLFIKKRSGFGPAKDVFGGLTNYIRAFQDADFLHSLLNIALFLVIQMPLMMLIATALALVLDGVKSGFAQRFFRTAFYLPYTVPSVIAGLLWGYLYSKNLSPFNQITGGGEHRLPRQRHRALQHRQHRHLDLDGLQHDHPLRRTAKHSDRSVRGGPHRRGKPLATSPATSSCRCCARPDPDRHLLGHRHHADLSEPFVLRPLGYVPDNITPNTYLYLVVARDGNFGYGATLAIVLALFTFILSADFS